MAWFSGYAMLGGLAVVGFALLHALAFLALKTDGEVRHRARQWFVRLLPVLLLPIAAWALSIQFLDGKPWTWAAVLLAVAAAVAAWLLARRAPKARRSLAMGLSWSWARRPFSARCSPWCCPPPWTAPLT